MMGVLWYVVKEDIPRKILTKHHFSSDIEGIKNRDYKKFNSESCNEDLQNILSTT